MLLVCYISKINWLFSLLDGSLQSEEVGYHRKSQVINLSLYTYIQSTCFMLSLYTCVVTVHKEYKVT